MEDKTVKCETVIDTIRVQINRDSYKEIERITSNLIEFLTEKKLGSIIKKEIKNIGVYSYSLVNGGEVLMYLYKNRTVIENYKTVYYLQITFAGLKRRKLSIDMLSEKVLFYVFGYLNTHNIDYRLKQLDIALDMFYDFNKILVKLLKRFKLSYDLPIQIPKKETLYIEDYSKKENISKRSYLYDKTKKERLTLKISRFEVQLMSNYFKVNGFNLEKIEKVLDNYKIICFKSEDSRNRALKKLNRIEKEIVETENIYHNRKLRDKRKKLILGMLRRNESVNFDINAVKKFIYEVQNVFIDITGNIRRLPKMEDIRLCQ